MQDYDSDALDSEPNPKKSRATSADSEDLDFAYTPSMSSPAGPSKSGTSTPAASAKGKTKSGVQPGPLKGIGNFMNCGECGNRFTVVSTSTVTLDFTWTDGRNLTV